MTSDKEYTSAKHIQAEAHTVDRVVASMRRHMGKMLDSVGYMNSIVGSDDTFSDDTISTYDQMNNDAEELDEALEDLSQFTSTLCENTDAYMEELLTRGTDRKALKAYRRAIEDETIRLVDKYGDFEFSLGKMRDTHSNLFNEDVIYKDMRQPGVEMDNRSLSMINSSDDESDTELSSIEKHFSVLSDVCGNLLHRHNDDDDGK